MFWYLLLIRNWCHLTFRIFACIFRMGTRLANLNCLWLNHLLVQFLLSILRVRLAKLTLWLSLILNLWLFIVMLMFYLFLHILNLCFWSYVRDMLLHILCLHVLMLNEQVMVFTRLRRSPWMSASLSEVISSLIYSSIRIGDVLLTLLMTNSRYLHMCSFPICHVMTCGSLLVNGLSIWTCTWWLWFLNHFLNMMEM